MKKISSTILAILQQFPPFSLGREEDSGRGHSRQAFVHQMAAEKSAQKISYDQLRFGSLLKIADKLTTINPPMAEVISVYLEFAKDYNTTKDPFSAIVLDRLNQFDRLSQQGHSPSPEVFIDPA